MLPIIEHWCFPRRIACISSLLLAAALPACADVTNEVDGVLFFEAENFSTDLSPRSAHARAFISLVAGFSGNDTTPPDTHRFYRILVLP
jgi:hypothetical protein